MAEVQVVGLGVSSGLVNHIDRASADVPGSCVDAEQLASCKADDNAGEAPPSEKLASSEVVEIRSDALLWRGSVGGGGHRTSRLGWSCEASTRAERGTDGR